MELLEHYFDILIQSAGSFYWLIGIVLLFLKTPHVEESVPYRRSKRLLAIAFFVMGFNLFAWLWLFQGDWHQINPYIACVDVSLFYLAAIFLAYSYSNLLNDHCLVPKGIAKDFLLWALTTGLACLSLWDKLGSFRNVPFMLSIVVFMLVIIRFLFIFHRLYDEKKAKLENYFSDDMQRFMFWLKKSLFFLILSGFFAVATLFFGIFFNYIYQFYVVTVNLYIAISFINYGHFYNQFNKVEETCAEETASIISNEEQKVSSVDNLEKQFGEQIQQWVADKKYLSPQLTIDSLAAELGTNKLYMSRYINGKYQVNFSTWVTDLRLEEAKTYMMEHPNVKQEEVAFHSGFSSSSYFSKVFSRAEGKTPAAWRKEMLTA